MKTKDVSIITKPNGDEVKVEITNETINKNGVNYRHYSKVINGETVIEYTNPINDKISCRFGVQVLSIEWDSK